MRLGKPIALCLMTTLGAVTAADACSRLLYETGTGSYIVARSMDWSDTSAKTSLWVFPQGMQRDGGLGENPLKWTSQYGSVIATLYDAATVDGINEKGLYVTCFHDPDSIGNEGTPTSGMKVAGLPLTQVPTLLLDTCASVEEAKMKILQNHVGQTMMRVHLLIADASGNATVFELDASGGYRFTDRKANEPLFVTNHELAKYPDPSAYPDFDINAEHNTFARQLILRDAYAGLNAPFSIDDVNAMTDSVHCSFVDTKKADSGPLERTLSNCTCDLSNPELSVRWYLGDVKPIPGTNHMEDRMSDFYTFGFGDR